MSIIQVKDVNKIYRTNEVETLAISSSEPIMKD